jgi:Mg-chelatase subunit ChlD
MSKVVAFLCALIVSLFALNGVYACDTYEMSTTESGFIHKIVAGSDKIIAFKDVTSKEEAYTLELLQPYFVICENAEFFKITDIAADTVDEAMSGNVGFVPKHQVHLWPTREALAFSEIAFLDERPEIVAWGDENVLKKFMETGNKRLHPPSFQEQLESTRKRERATRPYPVLGSQLRKLRKVADKRVYHVLLPAALPPEAKITIEEKDVETAKKVITEATIVVVFDATGSMDKFALETAKSISSAIQSLDSEVVDKSRMGFVFYRDENDTEKLVEIPPMPINDAANALKEAASLMKGGDDVAEPLLDATYFAAHIYNWGQSGRRILIGVLNSDAKPTTIGTMDEKGRIPVGLDANSIAKNLYDLSMPIITVQAGPDFGENLELVMQTLGDSTGGEFIRWEAGSSQKYIAQALAKAMTIEAKDTVKAGKAVLSKLEYDFRGYASIPLEVLDGELLERLRRNGVDFNIDPGEGGVLIREGYILENDDLLTPQIHIDKETLQGLINLYSILGTTGLDADTFLRSAAEAIAAIAGESYDEDDTISEIIRKKLGINFRSELLNFRLEYLTSLVPAERLKFTKRIQEAGDNLAIYLEANLVEFDTSPAVWMPIAVLP